MEIFGLTTDFTPLLWTVSNKLTTKKSNQVIHKKNIISLVPIFILVCAYALQGSGFGRAEAKKFTLTVDGSVEEGDYKYGVATVGVGCVDPGNPVKKT